MRYLLDTNVISEPLRARPDPQVVGRIREHLGETAVPAPVWQQLRFGCSRLPPSKRRTMLESYLRDGVRSVFPIYPYDDAAADWHGRERARLQATGTPRPSMDLSIAAIAHANGLVLVTRNLRDFANLKGVMVESWHQS